MRKPIRFCLPLLALWACTVPVAGPADSGQAVQNDAGVMSDAGPLDAGPPGDAGASDAGCVARTCEAGVSCDDMDDGCGGTLHCGTCGGGLICGGSGAANVCAACSAPTLDNSIPAAEVGTFYSANLVAHGYGVSQYSIVSATHPRDLTLSEYGLLSGTPREHGRLDFTVQVVDSCPTPNTAQFHFTLVVMIPGSGAVSVTNGLFHSLAVTYEQTVFAWGNNQDLALGSDVSDPTMARYEPAPVLDANDHPVTGALAVAAADRSSFALLTSGQVLSWGKNDFGVLGEGTTTARARAGTVMVSSGQPLDHITAIAAGQDHVLALTNTGSVVAWGRGDDGRLGDGSTNSHGYAQPVLIAGGSALDHAVAITATARASAALLDTHHVVTWGRDAHQHSYPTPLTWPGGAEVDSVVAIAGGSSHFLALTTEGKVIAWGDNEQGELGNGHTNQYDRDPAYVLSSEGVELTGVSAIAAGDRCSFAHLNGGVLGWGKNNIGELGDGTNVLSRPYPVQTLNYVGDTLTGVFGIAASRSTGWAFISGDHLVGWGDNSLGKLAIPWGFETSRSHADYVLINANH